MDIKTGRRKSFDIEFVRVTETNMDEVATWAVATVGGTGKDRYIKLDDKGAQNPLQKKAFVGDFVVRHLELGTFKKFNRKAFTASYEETEERVLNRSSESGQFVSHEEVVANPGTTVTETVEVGLTETEIEADKNAALPRDAGLD